MQNFYQEKELIYLTRNSRSHLQSKKNAKFYWGPNQSNAFQQLKVRLCSEDVLVPYDTKLPTRLYADSSPVGTQATVAQGNTSLTGEIPWRPVNHTSNKTVTLSMPCYL